MNIAIAGFAGSGKTQAAEYIVEKYSYNRISFADGIKWIDNEFFNTNGKKNRERLQKIGEYMREIDPDVWVRHVMKRVNTKTNIVVDDLRRRNEYYTLVSRGFYPIKIVADEHIRINRLVERDGICDVSLLYNESEIGVADIEMVEIENNGSLEELYNKIDNLLDGLLDNLSINLK